MTLPSGQHLISDFPRFGLSQYAERFPAAADSKSIEISGDVQNPCSLDLHTYELPMHDQISDFHCVTTWSCKNLHWRGYLFRDVFEEILKPHVQVDPEATHVIFCAQDGYKNILPLADLMAEDVMLATHLNEQPLSIAHGAPLRLVAPAHYGYKSVKHLKQIKFIRNPKAFKTVWYSQFLTHPRGRVAFEERGQGIPNWLFRIIFSRAINGNRIRFERAMHQYELNQS